MPSKEIEKVHSSHIRSPAGKGIKRQLTKVPFAGWQPYHETMQDHDEAQQRVLEARDQPVQQHQEQNDPKGKQVARRSVRSKLPELGAVDGVDSESRDEQASEQKQEGVLAKARKFLARNSDTFHHD